MNGQTIGLAGPGESPSALDFMSDENSQLSWMM